MSLTIVELPYDVLNEITKYLKDKDIIHLWEAGKYRYHTFENNKNSKSFHKKILNLNWFTGNDNKFTLNQLYLYKNNTVTWADIVEKDDKYTNTIVKLINAVT